YEADHRLQYNGTEYGLSSIHRVYTNIYKASLTDGIRLLKRLYIFRITYERCFCCRFERGNRMIRYLVYLIVFIMRVWTLSLSKPSPIGNLSSKLLFSSKK